MSNRIKVSTPTLSTRAQAEEALGEIRELTIEKAQHMLKIELAKKAAEDLHAARLAEIEKLLLSKTEQLKTWSEANPGEFGGKKSLDMTHGKIGFRLGNPQLKTLSKWTWDRVLEALRSAGLTPFIRTKEEVNKQALLDRAQDPTETFPLAGFGLRIAQDEPFFVDPKIEEQETRISTETSTAA